MLHAPVRVIFITGGQKMFNPLNSIQHETDRCGRSGGSMSVLALNKSSQNGEPWEHSTLFNGLTINEIANNQDQRIFVLPSFSIIL